MKFPRPSPSIFGLLQAIKNWRRRRPGNACFYALWISLGAWSRVTVYYASAGFRVSGNISVMSRPTVHTLYCCSNEATLRQSVGWFTGQGKQGDLHQPKKKKGTAAWWVHGYCNYYHSPFSLLTKPGFPKTYLPSNKNLERRIPASTGIPFYTDHLRVSLVGLVGYS